VALLHKSPRPSDYCERQMTILDCHHVCTVAAARVSAERNGGRLPATPSAAGFRSFRRENGPGHSALAFLHPRILSSWTRTRATSSDAPAAEVSGNQRLNSHQQRLSGPHLLNSLPHALFHFSPFSQPADSTPSLLVPSRMHSLNRCHVERGGPCPVDKYPHR
jgi:hypothetical protein